MMLFTSIALYLVRHVLRTAVELHVEKRYDWFEAMAITKEQSVTEFLTICRFGIIGVLATTTHIGIVWVLIASAGLHPLLANVLAFLVAFMVSFSGHYYWTFVSRVSRRQAIKRFFLISGSAFVVNNVVLVALLKDEQIAPLLATISAVFVIPVITYVLGRLWAFQD